MRIIDPSYEIEVFPEDTLERIEKAARTCYKSEGAICSGSASRLVRKLMRRGHTAMIEFGGMQVRFINDRGFTHELVRHRLASYAQESTRYCDYGGEVTFIRPCWWGESESVDEVWRVHMYTCEEAYKNARGFGAKPEQARQVLPISVKTEIIMKADLTEWLHVFRMRASKHAHPMMRVVMIPLLRECADRLPEVFGDLWASVAMKGDCEDMGGDRDSTFPS